MQFLYLIIAMMMTGLYADQPFEPLFMSGGVAPVVRDVVHSDILVLQTPEQFIQHVLKGGGQSLVYIDSSSRSAQRDDLALVAGVVRAWPRTLSLFRIDASTHAHLIRALGRTARLPSVSLPSVVVFVDGKAVLPVVAVDSDFERTLATRIAYARQQEKTVGWFSSWLHSGFSLLQGLWAKFTQYLSVS